MWMLRYVAGLVWFVSAPEAGTSATSPSQEDTSKGVEVAMEPTASAQPEPEGANKDAPAPALADQPRQVLGTNVGHVNVYRHDALQHVRLVRPVPGRPVRDCGF